MLPANRCRLFASAIRLGLLLLAAGCATQRQPPFYGWHEEYRLQDKLFRVAFHGVRYLRESEAMDRALWRAAELTIADGSSFFVVREKQVEVDESVFMTQYNAETIRAPNVSLLVALYEDKPEGEETVYDAKQIKRNLELQYAPKDTPEPKKTREPKQTPKPFEKGVLHEVKTFLPPAFR